MIILFKYDLSSYLYEGWILESTTKTGTWLSRPHNSTGEAVAWYRVVVGCKLEKVDRFKVMFGVKTIKLDNASI